MTEAMTIDSTKQVVQRSGIAGALATFSEVRTGTIRMAAGLSAEQAAFAPGRDSWSVGQILDHLILTEALYRTQMKRLLDLAKEGKRLNIELGLGEGDPQLPFIPRALMPFMAMPLTMMNMFVPHAMREAVLRVPIMKAKNPKITEPSAARSIMELRDHLRSSLDQTAGLFVGNLPRGAERVTVSHPIFGRNTIVDVIRLMTAHEQRHRSQITGIIRHSGFPAAREIE